MPRTPCRDDKGEALRRDAVLNPHPEKVGDPLFETETFFDPRDLIQVKYEMVRRVERDHLPVTEVCARFGLSRPAFYKARAALRRKGLLGLLPRKRGPRGGHKLSEDVLSVVERALQEDPSLDLKSLVRLVMQRFGRRVHPRSIQRALERRKKKPQ